MWTIWLFLSLVCGIASVSAYSPLQKHPPIDSDIFDGNRLKKTDANAKLVRAKLTDAGNVAIINVDNVAANHEQLGRLSEALFSPKSPNKDAAEKIRHKRQFHFHEHSGEHFHYDIPHPGSLFHQIHADVQFHPNPLLSHAHYRIPDPYSGGHYHANVHYHVDPFSGHFFPHAQMHYHPFRA